METIEKITEEMIALLDCLAYSGAMLPEEIEQLESLKAEFYAQQA